MRQGLSGQPRHDHEGSAEDIRIAFRHHHAGCRKAHVGERILDDGFQLHPPGIGIGVTEAQDQRPSQVRWNTIEREAKDRRVKAALNARRPGDIPGVRALEHARQMIQQPLSHFGVMEPMHRDEPPPLQRQAGLSLPNAAVLITASRRARCGFHFAPARAFHIANRSSLQKSLGGGVKANTLCAGNDARRTRKSRQPASALRTGVWA